MTMPLRFRADHLGTTLLPVAIRLLVMLLPTGLLAVASMRAPSPGNIILLMGTAFQAVVCFLSFLSRRNWQQSLGPSIITLYLIALCWLWWGVSADDWYTSLAKAILLISPLGVFAWQTLHESGAPAIRRARMLADRLAQRHDWPTDLAAIRFLPEVKALRAALHIDASPALALLTHPRIEVRVAALAALEFRKEWKPGQAELVLQVALRAEQLTLRAAAVYALANVDDRTLVERLAPFMHDPALEVRKAAVESLLWDAEHRWGWIRFTVRRVLADPLFQHDGPLWHDGLLLSKEAVNDLTAWTAEKGVLGYRAALTLGAHYGRALNERSDPELLAALKKQLADPSTAAPLRFELARVLRDHQELDPELLGVILGPSNAAPLRMIAIETVLEEHHENHLQAAAVSALRDLARLPNREIALATADVIQRRLGVDLGLGLGQPLPPVHSRQAAEITRRVMMWAVQNDDDDLANSRPLPNRA